MYAHIEYQYSYIMAASILVADILLFHGWFYVKCEIVFLPHAGPTLLNWEILPESAKHR